MTDPADLILSSEDRDLSHEVFQANQDLVRLGLVLFTWGNASAVDRQRGVMVIKPSGVPYDRMTPVDMVEVRLDDGSVLPGSDGLTRVPSSDAPTHLALYRAWPTIGGVIHTHSTWASTLAQAGQGIPAQGTTHADYFRGDVLCTRPLTCVEVEGDYEANTGAVILETMRGHDPMALPGILVDQHGPFAWGTTVAKAVYHGAVLERLAEMHLAMATLGVAGRRVPAYLLERHYLRKHGSQATYGQQ